MKSVFARSIFLSNALDLRRIGGIEHVQLGKPGDLAEGHAQHFRAKAGSAHAQQQDVREAAALGVLGNLAKLVDAARSVRRVMPSQPSHLASSVPVHREASRCHRRRTLPVARQSSMVCFHGRARFGGKLCVCATDLGLRSRTCLDLLDGGQQLSKASANSFTPSLVSLSVTSFMEMPACGEVVHGSRAPSMSSVRLWRSLP